MKRLLAAALLISAGTWAGDPAQPAPDVKQAVTKQTAKPPAKAGLSKYELTPPSYLPELAREYLHRRMERHGRDMQELMFSVVLLTREVARDTATRIATEPRLAKPDQSEDDTLNRALPPRFFVLQDELRDRAQKLADVAKSGTDQQIGAAFSKLTETCISCHSVYLNP